jgi:outer membrane lipoprotein-sorting protein
MQKSLTVRIGLILGCLAAAPAALAGPDAAAIVKKATAAMKTAKSYQATWDIKSSAGQMGTMSLSMEMKMVPASGKMYMKVAPTGQATGMMAMGAAFANTTMVDDGKTTYMYNQAQGGYYKNPHQANAGGSMKTPFDVASQKNATFKLLGTEKVKGSLCYVIDVKAPVPAMPNGMTMQISMYVDKASNKMKQIKQVMTLPSSMTGGMPGGQPGAGAGKSTTPSMQVTTLMVVKREKLNETLPDSAFKFTPPAGAKQLEGKPMGMGGLGLGGGGRP